MNKRIRSIYSGMERRCNNPKSINYPYYGGKGVKICSEWDNSVDNFIKWAKGNGYGETLQIDRIDGSKGYSPENCRWVTVRDNCLNRSSSNKYPGVSLCKTTRRYRVDIHYKGKGYNLGRYRALEIARFAYECAAHGVECLDS